MSQVLGGVWCRCVGVVFACVLVSGCAQSTTSEELGAEQSTVLIETTEVTQAAGPAPVRPPAVFDPCEDIPDEAVEAVGVDPATKYMSIAGNENHYGVHWDWHRACAWNGEYHRVWIASVDEPFEDVPERSIVENVREISINGRAALHYGLLACGPRVCSEVAFQTGAGSVWVNLNLSSRGDRSLQADDLVVEYAALLEPYLPAE
ncbi:DUF3558 domain-containing protein [Hoyosella rhizosphaerae]|uniref:DUF3558 domain-containing protein n=1 Tax=Hoyosella rhizosphaerae TaxID=1755582 RepID=A0A916TZW5_9ACTN|nr:DUF3558 domain-containing protein [Hoyosella rhizosphaerae]MBN4927139.1 DUF3558 domain-containing protein [Hoyosella rhizosphaerae]GGC53672.1 hypothetical protein GCM10011410_02570 [Hoyosella rhizosphaerae]